MYGQLQCRCCSRQSESTDSIECLIGWVWDVSLYHAVDLWCQVRQLLLHLSCSLLCTRSLLGQFPNKHNNMHQSIDRHRHRFTSSQLRTDEVKQWTQTPAAVTIQRPRDRKHMEIHDVRIGDLRSSDMMKDKGKASYHTCSISMSVQRQDVHTSLCLSHTSTWIKSQWLNVPDERCNLPWNFNSSSTMNVVVNQCDSLIRSDLRRVITVNYLCSDSRSTMCWCDSLACCCNVTIVNSLRLAAPSTSPNAASYSVSFWLIDCSLPSASSCAALFNSQVDLSLVMMLFLCSTSRCASTNYTCIHIRQVHQLSSTVTTIRWELKTTGCLKWHAPNSVKVLKDV